MESHSESEEDKTFLPAAALEGGQGCLISPPLFGISGLSFDYSFLSPLIFLCSLTLGMLPSKVPQSPHLGYSASKSCT